MRMPSFDFADDPVKGYRAGIVAGYRLLVAQVEDGEPLDEAVDDTLDRKIFSEYDNPAYAGLCEVFSWIGSLDLDGLDEDYETGLETTITTPEPECHICHKPRSKCTGSL